MTFSILPTATIEHYSEAQAFAKNSLAKILLHHPSLDLVHWQLTLYFQIRAVQGVASDIHSQIPKVFLAPKG